MTVSLSKQTLSILKNFATINPSNVFRAGSTIKTISNAENILAVANIPEEFPNDFAIYDLNQFLAGLSLFVSPTLYFDNNDYVTIKDERGLNQVKYYFSDPEITLKEAPDIKSPDIEEELEFLLTGKQLANFQRASSVYNLSDFVITGVSETQVKLEVTDTQYSTSNEYSCLVDGKSTVTSSVVVNIANIRLIDGDYKVSVSIKNNMARFVHKNQDITYYIALER